MNKDLAKLPPKVRLRKLKEIEEKKKKEVEEARKEIKKSQKQISEEKERRSKLLIPGVELEDLEIFARAQQELAKGLLAPKGARVHENDDEEGDEDDTEHEQGDGEESLEDVVRDAPGSHAANAMYGSGGVHDYQSVSYFQHKPIEEVYHQIKSLHTEFEERGYIGEKTPEEVADIAEGIRRKMIDGYKGGYNEWDEEKHAMAQSALELIEGDQDKMYAGAHNTGGGEPPGVSPSTPTQTYQRNEVQEKQKETHY